MTRHAFREHCLKLLFCSGFYPADELNEQMTIYFEEPDMKVEDDETEDGEEKEMRLGDDDREEVRARVDAVIEKLPELDSKLSEATDGWKLSRIGKVELNILRLALYEMLYDENVPEKVSINEAIELSKKYCGEESPAFINGVLAKLVSDKAD